MLILKMIYSQSDERGILDVLEIKIFFAAQPWWAEFLKNFLKFLFVDFVLWWWYLCKFLVKRKE